MRQRPSILVPKRNRPLLREGATGQFVRDLQNGLKQLGKLAERVDGDYGAETKQAVMLFQKDYGLEMDGVCGTATWAALNSALAKKG